MAAINHETGLEAGLAQTTLGVRSVARLVVPPFAAAPKDDVRVGVARGSDNRCATVLIDAEETVRRTRGKQGIERGLHAAIRAVFESHRHG